MAKQQSEIAAALSVLRLHFYFGGLSSRFTIGTFDTFDNKSELIQLKERAQPVTRRTYLLRQKIAAKKRRDLNKNTDNCIFTIQTAPILAVIIPTWSLN